MPSGNDRKADDHRERVCQNFGSGTANPSKQRIDQMCQGRLSNPSQCQTGKCNAQLCSRNIGIQMRKLRLNNLRSLVALLCQLINTSRADFYQSKFARNEETVGRNECHYSYKADNGTDIHQYILLPL